MLCPECGVPMEPTDPICQACGFRIGGGGPPPEEMSLDAPEEAPPDQETLQYQAPEGPASGIKVRRNAAPIPRKDRPPPPPPDPDSIPSAEGATGGGDPAMPQVIIPPKHPAGAPAPSPPSPSSRAGKPPAIQKPSGTSVWATMALVFGLLGFCTGFVLGPLAVIFAMLGYRDVRRGGGAVEGRGRATFGLVMGIVQTVVLISVVGIVVTLGGPSWVQGKITQVRMVMSVALLERVAVAQSDFHTAGIADADRDGKGEYGTLEQVDAFLEGADLAPLTTGTLGWSLTIELPRTASGRERTWWGVLQPVGADPASQPWFYVDETQIVRRGEHVNRRPTRRQAKSWPPTSSRQVFERMSSAN